MMELSSLELRSNLELEFGRMELDSFWNSRVFGTREFLELESFGTRQFLELESFGTLRIQRVLIESLNVCMRY